jgi:hypothetical protein
MDEDKLLNYNLFVGDIGYKTNFFLKFKKAFSLIRFEKTKFQRYFYQIKGLVLGSAILFLFSSIYDLAQSFSFLTLLISIGIGLCHLLAFSFTKPKYHNSRARTFWIFISIYYQYFLLSYFNSTSVLILSNLATFLASKLTFYLNHKTRSFINLCMV